MKSLKLTRIKIPRLKRKIPKPVIEALELLHSKHYVAWLAGGCVRDLLLRRTPKDWDIVTDAPVEVQQRLFVNHLEVGKAFGILKLPPQSGVSIDVGYFRKESRYTDYRHPDAVEVGTVDTDCQRRDFTINALYYDYLKGDVIDGVSGVKDLINKRIRAVGDPSIRFNEDALRILRAARFQAQLGFRISKRTQSAMVLQGHLLSHISRERIREEVFKALNTPRAFEFLKYCWQLKIWPIIFGPTNQIPRFRKSFKSINLKLKLTPALWWIASLQLAGLIDNPKEILRLSSAEEQFCRQIQDFLKACTLRTSHRLPEFFIHWQRENPGALDFVLATTISLSPKPNSFVLDDAYIGIQRLKRFEKIEPSNNFNWIKSQDLINQGILPGPQLGKALAQANWERFWNFRFSKVKSS